MLVTLWTCSPPGSSVPAISQARTLEWVAIASSRGSSQPGTKPASPALAGRFFTNCATWEAPYVPWVEVIQSTCFHTKKNPIHIYVLIIGAIVTRTEMQNWQEGAKATVPFFSWHGVQCPLGKRSLPTREGPRTPEWVNVPFSRGSSRPRDWTQVSRIAGRSFTVWATRKAQKVATTSR